MAKRGIACPRPVPSSASSGRPGESRENEEIPRMIGHEPFDASCLANQFLSLAQAPR